MDTGKLVLVVCLVVLAVVALNAGLFLALRRDKRPGQLELLRRSTQSIRQPWQAEEDALKELSQRVAALKKADSGEEPPDGR